MKDKLTSFERRIEMLFLISRQKNTSMPELADIFSVSITTVYRDIVFLTQYAPIYTKNGLHGGVFLLDNYKPDIFLYLSKDEECLLNRLANKLADREKYLMQNIINKYSMPKVRV